ncbi:tRNA 2-thiouridine(34) synthase MnmA [Candidatus Saccharibacteria bacterium]|nr:tRNA 2-thiouridine(34) synthase MnmA [Candidatus Saccharibacteria bacterium]
MSGGVDSSVSAVLLKEQGYNVVGVYMKNWSEDLPGMKCPWAEDLADAKRVAVKLGIDFLVFDFQQEYKNKVVDYMLTEFKKGNTPNPDIMCNQEIKFKLFYDIAREKGADYIATGHYARVNRDKSELLRAVDENKDQTYFLYRISNEAIAHTIFPVGEMLKADVKKYAAERGLDNAYKKESMGVCFVGEVGMKDFLKRYVEANPGEIFDIDTGEKVGVHEGAIFYTIGQRKGLGLGGGLPYYVVKKDIKKNIVYVSKNLNNQNLWTRELKLKDVLLRGAILKMPRSTLSETEKNNASATAPTMKVMVRLRHRAPLIPATLTIDNLGDTDTSSVETKIDNLGGLDTSDIRASVKFDEEVKAPAVGQSVVFYDGEVCLGGGIIDA